MLEELNYEALYRADSPRERKSAADPQVMFEVLVYGYLCGIYSSRKLEEACRYRVAFMWFMGDGRNSYSKTDEDATFMRMKEDHMRNGRLKPGYNVQIGVNSEYITGIEVVSDRSDVKTLKPFLWRLEGFH